MHTPFMLAGCLPTLSIVASVVGRGGILGAYWRLTCPRSGSVERVHVRL